MKLEELIRLEGIPVKMAREEYVFMQGDSDNSLYFIETGLLKAYYTSIEGKEFVKSFLFPNDLIGSLTSSYSGDTCSFSLICLKSTTLIKIPFIKLQEYSQKDIEIANNMIELLLQFAMKKEKREYEFLCLSAEERYRMLSNNSPTLVDEITQNDLARYLGITPVGLSRIKKRQA